MEKLTCPVCGLELTGLEAACPRCTFPNISSASGSEEEKQALEKLVVEFRRRYWSNAKISLNVYTNRLTDDGEVEVAQTEQITLAKAGDLEPGKILWYPEKFARLFGDCTLNVIVESNDGAREEHSVTLENPRVQDFWSVGVLSDEKMNFRIVIGTEKQYSSSGPIAML